MKKRVCSRAYKLLEYTHGSKILLKIRESVSRMLKKLNAILNIIAIIFLLVVSISITKLNILPGKYYYPLIVLVLVMMVLFILSIFKNNKKGLLIASIISSIVISIISSLGLIYLNSTNNLLDNISFKKEKSI